GRYRLEDVDLFDVLISEATAGQQTVRLGSAAASVAYDSRDDIINPTRGGLRSFDARIYQSGLGSEATFTRFFGSASFFKSLGPHVVWASSIRAGVITSNNIPVSERFFAGGDTTLRGFDFNKAGPAEQVKPLDDDNDPNTPLPPLDPGEVNESFFEATGGEGLFLINQELRFPIFKALKGAVFYDMGNVFADISDYNVTELRHVAGIGLRFDTPVGPFRIEYGRKLDHETIFVLDDPSDPGSPGRFIRKPEERGKFFFSIGHAF
ncbi:MAG TPA: BamA/TamA family outer membrane protein, partial [Candidatus Polarisedimenticolia bacterium]|nr:BamA/TamA family outer membrane protein [Candidatus Polarisedimenticolia bacterium]